MAMTDHGVAQGTEAVSLDGRTFTFRGDDSTVLVPGDLVALDDGEAAGLLGQVAEVLPGPLPRSLEGSGTLVGGIGPDGILHPTARRPFHAATVAPAPAAYVEALQSSTGADLPVGTWRSGGVSTVARLRTGAFNRHTFLCGQSGSGKTYALGVLLEQLLIATELLMVVLDPNGDFVRLGETRPDAPAAARERIAEVGVRVLRRDGSGGEPLRLRFMTMNAPAQAAILQLDPIADRAEYNQFIRTLTDMRNPDLHELVEALVAGNEVERALGQRIQNLGLPEWQVWARGVASAAEVVASGSRATVMDLGGFRDPLEPLAVSLELIEDLWTRRHDRTPTLIVIDEAHNLCSAEPSHPLHVAVTERLVQIAAEGRKYGLWLLLSTQRPSKIHPQVLSQCDNLALMRMNSRGDLDELATVFGFAPRAMLDASPAFAQGEMLVAGGFAPVPSLVRVGARLTYEGGSDVRVPRL